MGVNGCGQQRGAVGVVWKFTGWFEDDSSDD